MSIQSTEALSGAEAQESRWTALAFDPGVNVKISKAVYVGMAAVLAARNQGRADFGLGVQPRVGINQKVGSVFHILAELQAPFAVHPSVSLQITPLVGLGYTFLEPREPKE